MAELLFQQSKFYIQLIIKVALQIYFFRGNFILFITYTYKFRKAVNDLFRAVWVSKNEEQVEMNDVKEVSNHFLEIFTIVHIK